MLHPYRVLDFTDERGELGPMLLGDLGADVIRVEPPDGSAARRVLPSGPSESLSFQAFNRNKRSIVLHNGDRDVLESLVRSADFLFESAWPSTLAPFRLDADAVRTINPHIVHVRVSPFGSDGPSADYLGNDLVIAALRWRPPGLAPYGCGSRDLDHHRQRVFCGWWCLRGPGTPIER